jgi:hypothetical protein
MGSGKRLTVEEVVERVRKVHGDELTLDTTTYTKIKEIARFIRKDGTEWWPHVADIINGCSRPGKVSIKEVKKRLEKVHKGIVSIIENTFIDMGSYATFVDIEYGEWTAKAYSVLQGHGHPGRGWEEGAKANRIDLDFVLKKLKEVHGDTIALDITTYKGISNNARFIDKDEGEWWPPVYWVLKGTGHPNKMAEKLAQTCEKIYGFRSANQNREIALKGSKTRNNSTIKFHWKTGEELICTASYEPKVVDYLNYRKIDFHWQPKVFEIPTEILVTPKGNKITYRPDFYLPDQDIWVEIKGWMMPKSKPKWDWFKTQFPTAELWDKKKLKEMGIL